MGDFKVVAPHYEVLLMVDFGDTSEFGEWAGGATAVDQVVTGLGDAAYAGPKDAKAPFMLGFRKGSRAVRLSAVKVKADGSRAISLAQMRELADLMATRL